MKLTHYDNPCHFYEQVESYLLWDEAQHNLLFEVLNGLIYHPERFHSSPYMATVEADGTLLGVALMTSPWKLLVSKTLDQRVAMTIAQDPVLHQRSVSGVLGTLPEAKAFAEYWQQATGQPYRPGVSLRNYRLDGLKPVPRAQGYLRSISTADRDLLIQWITAFYAETDADHGQQSAEFWVDCRLKDGTLYVWQDQVPVAMVNDAGYTPNGNRINAVYTPPEHRKQGYATSAVTTLCRKLLEKGRRFCFLFADAANPISNHIYQSVGFRQTGEVQEYLIFDM